VSKPQVSKPQVSKPQVSKPQQEEDAVTSLAHAEHDAEHAPGGHGHGTKAILAALFANLGIALAKFIGFLITGSASLLAEAVHSLADTTNQGLLLLGGKQAKKDQTEQHQFGYGMSRYFWSFVVALVLFSLGAVFALYEGVQKLQHPHELEKPAVAIGILLVAVLLEGYSFRTAIVESRPLKGSQSWWSFIRTSKVPELPVLLLEDSGALVGLLIALVSVVLVLITGNADFDAYGTLAIGVLLGFIAVVLIVEMRSLLLGEGATPEMMSTIRSTIQGSPSVKRFIHARTMHIGPEDLLVVTKVELDASLTFTEIADAIDAIEARIRAVVPEANMIYIEPAIFDSTRS
jgi:cation diffusion facilitator family transporter